MQTIANIRVRQFTAGSLLKLGFMANIAVWLPVGTLFGLLALFRIAPVTLNQTPTYGVAGLIGGLLIAALFILVGSVLFAIGALIARRLVFGDKMVEYRLSDELTDRRPVVEGETVKE